MSTRARMTAVAIGLTGGVVSGLLGVGGGVVMVPGLVLGLRVAQRRAHATSLAAIAPVAAVGAAVYAASDGMVHLGFAGLLAAGSVVGAPLGVRALAVVPERALRAIFVVASLVAGIRLVIA